eukprot:5254853-Prymnesium_polylepis.1
MPNLASVPDVPDLASVPNVPNLASVPNVPNLAAHLLRRDLRLLDVRLEPRLPLALESRL